MVLKLKERGFVDGPNGPTRDTRSKASNRGLCAAAIKFIRFADHLALVKDEISESCPGVEQLA